MADEKERVDWSALMDAHGIDPDADTASPAAEPKRRIEVDGGEPRAGRSRLVHGIIAVTALLSIAASAAVLIVLLRGSDGHDEEKVAAAEPVAVGPRPAAFEQTSDGVSVVPAAADEEPARATPPPPAQPPAPPPTVAEKPAAAAAKPERKPERKPEKKPAKTEAKEAPAAPEPASPEPPDPNLPDEPDKDGVASAMANLEKDIAACAAPAKVTGEVGIKMHIDPDGKVAWASARVQNSAFQACLDRLFKKARMPKSAKGATVRQTVQLP